MRAGAAALPRTRPGSCLWAEKLHGRTCERAREEKLHENSGVIFVMGEVLIWVKSSAGLDPLLNILTYQKISK